MSDREKIIDALENADVINGVIRMSNQFKDMVVTQLKEQEPMAPVYDQLLTQKIPRISMTNYEYLKSLTIEELAKWLHELCDLNDIAPSEKWLSEFLKSEYVDENE